MVKDEGKRNKLRSSKKARIASSFIVIFAILYIPSLFYWLYAGSVVTDIVKYGNLEDSMNMEGYLVRNEYVLKSEQKGIFFSEVNEGERVQAFSKIVSILSDKNKDLMKELSLKEQKLIEYHRDLSKKSGVVSSEIQKIDDDISKKMEEIVLADNINDISRIVGLKSEIETLVKKKVQIIALLNIKDENFNKIREERKLIKNNIDKSTAEISSPSSGMVSYMVDGLERTLTFDSIKRLKPQELKSLSNNAIFMVAEDSHIEAGKPFAKIITDNEYDIVFYTQIESAQSFQKGSEVKVRIIPINRTISGYVDFVSENQQGEVIVSVRVDRALAETSAFRKINISIIKTSYSGFKIPLKSLIEFNPQDKTAKLMLLKGGVARLVDILVDGYNQEFAIVENIGNALNNGVNLYDMYVVNGNNVQEGQFIN